jgi:hypothetical protein
MASRSLSLCKVFQFNCSTKIIVSAVRGVGICVSGEHVDVKSMFSAQSDKDERPSHFDDTNKGTGGSETRLIYFDKDDQKQSKRQLETMQSMGMIG